ncbi:MAG: hypothetical protein DMF62_07625 [Acidobacteria bacterium]|nr:MAG: hypothetical protein DMF62_07625 [Acidobacteriota bacterium]
MAEDEWVTGKVGLRVGNVPLDLEMTVPARPVKPHRMLPVFHQMADSFADIGIQAESEAGKHVSCKAKCASCCHQAIPVSEVEAYYIADLVAAMPEPRRTEIVSRFAKTLEHFKTIGWFDDLHSSKAGSMKGAERLVLWYFNEQIPCPFLEDSMCSIYEQRPIACREYLATSPAENCSSPSAEGVRLVGLPIKPSTTMKQLTEGEASKRAGFLLLIMALEIAKKYPETFPEKTGEQWMAEFFGKLTSEPQSVPEAPPQAVRKRPKKRGRHGPKR